MQNVPPTSIRERLLSEDVRGHEISGAAVAMVHDLLRHGLSLEQALVGTGLVTAQIFAHCMEEASGLPLLAVVSNEKTLPPGLERETIQAWRVIPQKQGKQGWLIGLTDPWDQEVRSALEALAVEHGWQLSFAVALPSLADRWWRGLESGRVTDPLMRYARDLVARVEKESTIAQHDIPHAWYPALKQRLVRRRDLLGIDLDHAIKTRYPTFELRRRQRAQSEALRHAVFNDVGQSEHPVRDWTPALQAFFDQGMMVFLVDLDGALQAHTTDRHTAHEQHEVWRSAEKRWVAQADRANQEELFHLTLSGYPGTVCFSSSHELGDWERAADEAGVPYAACIGRGTSHGIAWSIYST